LVRRPGGIAAWVPTTRGTTPVLAAPLPEIMTTAPETQTLDLLSGGENISISGESLLPEAPPSVVPLTPISVRTTSNSTERPGRNWDRVSKRRRHASLDLDEKIEIVLWDPNHASTR